MKNRCVFKTTEPVTFSTTSKLIADRNLSGEIKNQAKNKHVQFVYKNEGLFLNWL